MRFLCELGEMKEPIRKLCPSTYSTLVEFQRSRNDNAKMRRLFTSQLTIKKARA